MASKVEPSYVVVVPVANKGCSFPSAVPLPLSEELDFRKIRGDDLALITEIDTEETAQIKGGTYTLTFGSFDPASDVAKFRTKVLSALFALNVLSDNRPLSVGRAFVIRTVRKSKISQEIDLSVHKHADLGSFDIAKGTDVSDANKVYTSALAALDQHAALRITLSRFNSSMGRSALDDKLIDLCIALETIFQSQTEISYQFALYNTLLSEEDTKKRENIFKLLKKLYSQRSDLVHGKKELDKEWLEDNWEDLLRIAKASILRKIDFLSSHDHNAWKAHLETLALGM